MTVAEFKLNLILLGFKQETRRGYGHVYRYGQITMSLSPTGNALISQSGFNQAYCLPRKAALRKIQELIETDD